MLTKLVNGVEVVMSDAEESAIKAEWAATIAQRAADEPGITQKKNQLEALKTRLQELDDLADLTAVQVKENIRLLNKVVIKMVKRFEDLYK